MDTGETYVWANGVAVNSSFWGRSNSNVNKRFAQLRFRKRSFRLITAFGIYKRYALCETDPVGGKRRVLHCPSLQSVGCMVIYFLLDAETTARDGCGEAAPGQSSSNGQ